MTTVMKSGYGLAEVVDIIDQVKFDSAADYHAMSVIYERLLSEVGSDATWSGEFYTPRPVVELMVTVTPPQLGEVVHDPCSGSCGFLVFAYENLKPQANTIEGARATAAAHVSTDERPASCPSCSGR